MLGPQRGQLRKRGFRPFRRFRPDPSPGAQISLGCAREPAKWGLTPILHSLQVGRTSIRSSPSESRSCRSASGAARVGATCAHRPSTTSSTRTSPSRRAKACRSRPGSSPRPVEQADHRRPPSATSLSRRPRRKLGANLSRTCRGASLNALRPFRRRGGASWSRASQAPARRTQHPRQRAMVGECETVMASGSCTARSSVGQTGFASAPLRRCDGLAHRTVENSTRSLRNADCFDGRTDSTTPAQPG